MFFNCVATRSKRNCFWFVSVRACRMIYYFCTFAHCIQTFQTGFGDVTTLIEFSDINITVPASRHLKLVFVESVGRNGLRFELIGKPTGKNTLTRIHAQEPCYLYNWLTKHKDVTRSNSLI